MKKLIATIFLIAAMIGNSFAQGKTGVTTEEEYNYMTKGYQMQLAGGLDMKKGYTAGDATTIAEGSYSFKFIPLYRGEGAAGLLVGYIVKAVSTSWNNTYWYGLPIGDKELLNKTFTSIAVLDESMTTAFFKAYAELNLMKG